MTAVGATNVGSINVHFDPVSNSLDVNQEIFDALLGFKNK